MCRGCLDKGQPGLQLHKDPDISLRKLPRRPGCSEKFSSPHISPSCAILGGSSLLPLNPCVFSFFPFLILSF